MTTTTVPNPSAEQDVYAFPVSFAQQRLWYLDRVNPRSAAYNLFSAVRINTSLNLEALEQSLHAIGQRHEVLRTIFVVREGQPMQMIVPHLEVPLVVADLEHLPEDQRETEVLRLANAEVQQPFDLAHGPLLRITLFRLGAEEYLLLLTIHHIIFDGWSEKVFFRELATLYHGFASGQPATLPELPIQYVDYAIWQREQLQGEVLEEQLAYWKKQLAGAPTVLELPTDHPRPALPTFRGSMHLFTFSRALTDSLKALSRLEGVSLFTALVAAFQTLLYRYTGQDDLMLGTTTADRSQVETENLIGFFVNTLVLRGDLSGNPTFRELLGRVREVVLGAQAHQDVPIEYLVKELRPDRSLGQNPFFQVMLSLDPQTSPLPSEWPIIPLEIKTGASKFELSLEIQDRPEGLLGYLEYNTDLFDEATIVRLVGHWQKLLECIVADPTQRIDNLPILPEVELHQQIVQWNATVTDFPLDRCFHQLFEAQVERTPEAVAVVFEQEQLTYQELNQRANQLAHHLQKLGVVPETLVALLIERSINFVVAILAVFKAGGAFLPLDPEHPAKRHCQILKQSGCRLVLTINKHGSELAPTLEEIDASHRPQILQIEILLQKEAAKENLPLQSVPGNLAYVMYTSGSTGVPKGVMVEQVGMVNHIYAKMADLAICLEDRVAQNGPPCFDIVVWQCLAALLVGGEVHIFKDEIAHDPKRLLEQIEKKKITILQAVPSILRAAVQQAEMLGEERPPLANLRWAVPTGDALSPELCRQWLQLYPAIPLLNTYGSTECSDDQCHYAIYQPPALDYPLSIMPIGRPIQNMQAYVLDQQLMPVPIGVVGDLYIGGIGVGRGYLHDAERTAEVFLPDPFAREPGTRLYKTRDRARYLPDGSLEFLGRTDHLVKIQGVRIEPGEIEALLERHPSVREAVVIAREASGGNKYLTAYIVPIHDQRPTGGELRTWLREKLPEYMVPANFMLLDAIPLNSNGKLDRRALPTPEQIGSELKETFVAPTLPVHEQLIQIWEELLDVRPIGIRDNFFELGGHSLLAVRLVDRMEQVWGKRILPATLVAGATIEQLATVLEQSEDTNLESVPTAVQAGEARRSFFSLIGRLRRNNSRQEISTKLPS